MNEGSFKLLKEIAKRCKSERSPYVPVAYFKHLNDYKKNLKNLKREGLIFIFKRGEAVGISKKGLEMLKATKKEKSE
jgi:hypothetical protein